MNNDPGLENHQCRVSCSCGPLVYVRTLKCASTFFWHSFNQKFGWEEIVFDNINWETQQVFSHIQNPSLRRIKGVTEFIWMNGTHHRLAEPDYRTFIQQTPVLDQHTVSYHENFGERCDQIDWIPVDSNNHQVTADLTSRLVYDQGIFVFNHWHWPFKHPSPPEKRLLEQQVAVCLAEVATPAVDEYLRKDHVLYQQVIDRFDSTAKTWAETTWLR
jgi:hypothetical protein